MGKQSNKAWVSQLIRLLEELSQELPDCRKGRHNQKYELADAVLGAFSVFQMQSGSFLAHQRDVEARLGLNNAATVFGMREIPSDNHIRTLLDAIPAERFGVCYDWVWKQLAETGELDHFRVMDGRLLVGIDGIVYHSSSKIHCEQCTQSEVDGRKRYQHRALTALAVHPEQKDVLALMPEFVTPQDGTEKQDCELNAAKRWLKRHQSWLQAHQVILMGDDLYSHQPFCAQVTAAGLAFIFVCKRASHSLLYEWIDGMDRGGKLAEQTKRRWNGRHGELWHYRWAQDVPLRAGDDGMRVNWCSVTVTHEKSGRRLYYNSFVTRLPVDERTVVQIAAAGRARWKHENEGHNVLTTRGYNIKHNFGHGKDHLSTVLFTLNMLAFLMHTFLHRVDWHYRTVRAAFSARRVFFEDLRAVMRWQAFASWEAMFEFRTNLMGLEPP